MFNEYVNFLMCILSVFRFCHLYFVCFCNPAFSMQYCW